LRPLEGFRVLDLTHVLAGPFCTYQLAVLGADVIKIESPDNPDMTREEGLVPELNRKGYGIYYQSQSAGKRAITLNLKTREGRELLSRLIETADVLVQNYAGDALAELGFGYEQAAAINPRLVYCQLTGFGRTGPKAGHPAYDVVIQAFSGLMAANGTPDSGPVRVGPPMVDYGTGAQAALAISAALLQRERSGKGQHIDVAMLDSALMLMSAHVIDTVTTGHAPKPYGNAHPSYAGYRTYETADGLIMIGAWTNRQLADLLRVLGETKRADDVLDTPRARIGELAEGNASCIAAHMKTRTADDWERALNEAHVPASRVRTIDEALAHEQVRSRKVMQSAGQLAHEGGPGQFPVSGFSYAHDGPAIDRPPPRLGEHTAEVLQELGLDDTAIGVLRQSGAI
jgi:crotonobetainyl-CoA:carnitine CoA-transferase CaiB-like acyl-CoA transferase